jgi:glycoside/pentoside/hexuronide:cation symporter, GPH family
MLGFRQRFSYGIGDFAFNLYFTTAGLYLLFYYTDVLGLPPATAGWVFAGALIWDALFDPVMGYVANRTRSRWGRYRPWLLWGAVPLGASWVIMFLPLGLSGSALVLFAAASHILFRTMYAVVSMPFLALSAVLSTDSGERGVLAAFRMVSAATCGLLSAFATLKLVDGLGGGADGFFHVAILYAGLATLILWFVFANTRESAAATDEQPPGVAQMLHMLARNRAFWIVCAAMLIGAFGGTFFQKTLPYHFKYALRRPDLIPLALTLLTGAVTLSIPLWTLVMRRTSKRTMWLCGTTISVTGFALLWAAPVDATTQLAILPLLGLGAGATYLCFWAMMPDTVEYGAWRSGVRAEGAVFGLVSLVQKAGLGLAAAALGQALAAIGYQANMDQRPETLAAMRTLMILAPGLLALLTGLVIAFYPLDGRLHGRITRALAWRAARAMR